MNTKLEFFNFANVQHILPAILHYKKGGKQKQYVQFTNIHLCSSIFFVYQKKKKNHDHYIHPIW